MQDRYTGDLGDFSKLGILRALRETGLSIGVNWYLTPDENHNRDGCHVKYLELEKYKSCDEELWRELKEIVENDRRKVRYLEKNNILQAIFFSERIDFTRKTKHEREEFRQSWHTRALSSLEGMDIIFADPDNGLIVPSAVGKRKENKYVLINELSDYYGQHSSVIYYQHKARKKDDFYTLQHANLICRDEFPGAEGLALKFISTSQRYYFFIIQPRHKKQIEKAVANMLASQWRDYYTVL